MLEPPFPRLNRFMDRHDLGISVALLLVSLAQLFVFDALSWHPRIFGVYSLSVALISLCYVLLLFHTILRVIIGHRTAGLRDVVFFLISYATLILMFALYYGCFYNYMRPSLGPVFVSNEGRTLCATDFLYYSGVVMTTMGFGDIVPAHASMKLWTVFQAAVGQIFLVLGIGAVVGGIQTSSGRTGDRL